MQGQTVKVGLVAAVTDQSSTPGLDWKQVLYIILAEIKLGEREFGRQTNSVEVCFFWLLLLSCWG